MGFLSEIKKLLFVNKSVAKSAAEKTKDIATEKGADLLKKSTEVVGDLGDTVMDKTSGLRDAVLDKGSDLLSSSKETFDNLSEKIGGNDLVNKAGEMTESLGEKVMEKGAVIGSKLKDVTGDAGEKLAEITEDLGEKFGDTSEKVGSKVLDAKDKLMEKANEVTGKVGEKLDETIKKAEAFKAEQDAIPKRDFVEDDLDAGGSMLEGTDDFFSKAEKFADGDHGAFSEGKITITESENQVSKDPAKAAGFKDLDGDGNELIDDAIVE